MPSSNQNTATQSVHPVTGADDKKNENYLLNGNLPSLDLLLQLDSIFAEEGSMVHVFLENMDDVQSLVKKLRIVESYDRFMVEFNKPEFEKYRLFIQFFQKIRACLKPTEKIVLEINENDVMIGIPIEKIEPVQQSLTAAQLTGFREELHRRFVAGLKTVDLQNFITPLFPLIDKSDPGKLSELLEKVTKKKTCIYVVEGVGYKDWRNERHLEDSFKFVLSAAQVIKLKAELPKLIAAAEKELAAKKLKASAAVANPAIKSTLAPLTEPASTGVATTTVVSTTATDSKKNYPVAFNITAANSVAATPTKSAAIPEVITAATSSVKSDSKTTMVVTDDKTSVPDSWPTMWLVLDIDETMINSKTGEWNGGLAMWQNFLRDCVKDASNHQVNLKIAVVSARLLADAVLVKVVTGLQEFLFRETTKNVRVKLFDGKQFAFHHADLKVQVSVSPNFQTKAIDDSQFLPVFLTRRLLMIGGTFVVPKSFCMRKIQNWDNCPAENVILWDDLKTFRAEVESHGFGTLPGEECNTNPQAAFARAKKFCYEKIMKIGKLPVEKQKFSISVSAMMSGLVGTIASPVVVSPGDASTAVSNQRSLSSTPNIEP